MSEKQDDTSSSEELDLLKGLEKMPLEKSDSSEIDGVIVEREAVKSFDLDNISFAWETIAEAEKQGNSGVSLDQQYKDEQNKQKLKRQQSKDNQANTLFDARLSYAKFILGLCIGWMFFIGLFVMGCGLQYLKVSDAVQIALITTTTINVLGIYYIVANWLFPKKVSSESKKLKE